MTEQEWMTSTDPAAMLLHLQGVTDSRVRAGELRSSAMRRNGVTDRKLRLFSCACKLETSTSVLGTAYAEMLVDGNAPEMLREFHDPLRLAQIWCDWDGLEFLAPDPISQRMVPKPVRADLLRHIVGNPFRVSNCGWRIVRAASDMSSAALESGASEEQVWFGDWMPTRTVFDLAQQLYDGRDVAPILHDALLDAAAPDELVEHFAEYVPCQRCGGTGWRDDVAGEDLDGRGGRVVNVRCEHDDSLVPMVQECNDGGRSWWFNLLEPNTRHLTPERARPRHMRGCWAIDAILGKE